MRNWTKDEMDFFFSIIAKLRDEGTREVKFVKHDLLKLANSSIRHKKRFADTIESLIKHCLNMYYFERTSNSMAGFALFSRFKANWTDDYSEINLTVKVTEEFDYIINKLDSSFTQYELKEFTQIRSTYAKTVYRLLKQWRTIGRKEYPIEEFKILLDTPEKYGPSEIDKNVLAAVMRELPQFFPGLKVKKIKANTKGSRVIGYLFTWRPETTSEWIEDKYLRKQPHVVPLPEYMQEGYQKTNADLSEDRRQELLNQLRGSKDPINNEEGRQEALDLNLEEE